ncbi:MAG: SUF system NifU family Fe-S cluster assembly protein [Acidobacteriota bacterium]
MSDLRDLYQEVILDHSKRPRNMRLPGGEATHATGHNPLCGDKLTVHVTVDAGVVRDVCFEGSGCAISTASASMMTEALTGRPIAEVERIFEAFHGVLTGQPKAGDVPLGKLEVFAGVAEFPVRVKCATLAWHTMRAALGGATTPISTEGAV